MMERAQRARPRFVPTTRVAPGGYDSIRLLIGEPGSARVVGVLRRQFDHRGPSVMLNGHEHATDASAPVQITDTGSPFDGASNPEPGIALCLSGGGYRAMLFHLGALWRLNEWGYLPKLSRIS